MVNTLNFIDKLCHVLTILFQLNFGKTKKDCKTLQSFYDEITLYLPNNFFYKKNRIDLHKKGM